MMQYGGIKSIAVLLFCGLKPVIMPVIIVTQTKLIRHIRVYELEESEKTSIFIKFFSAKC